MGRSTQAEALSPLIPASADRPGDDPIFALNAEAQRRAQAGEDVLNSTLGALMDDEGRLAVMPSVFEAFRRVPPEQAAGYAPISGPPRFLRAVEQDLFGDGPLASLAVSAATPGGTGACHHALVNFLEPGQKLLTTSYFWGPYAILAEHTRRGIETFEMFSAGGGLNLDALEAALDRQVREQGRVLLILNTPCHNPTGYSLDDSDWGGITELLAGRRRPGTHHALARLRLRQVRRPGLHSLAAPRGAAGGEDHRSLRLDRLEGVSRSTGRASAPASPWIGTPTGASASRTPSGTRAAGPGRTATTWACWPSPSS